MEGHNQPTPAIGQNPPAPAEGVIIPPIPQNHQQQPVRTVLNYLPENSKGLNPVVTMPEFNYNNMTDNLRNQITSFRQEDDEAMHETWERYIDLFRHCPMQGMPEWTQVSIFYNSVNTPTRMMLDASANGTLLDKQPRQGLEILEKLAQNDYQHPTTHRGNMRRGTIQLDSSDTILAQISTLTNMVKNKQRQSNTQEVKVVDAFCKLCDNNHDASECGHAPKSSYYVREYNKNVMSNAYNPTWRKHPNFSWQNQNNTLNPKSSTQQGYQNQPRQDYQQPNNYGTLGNTLNTFMTQTYAYMARTNQFIQKTDSFMDQMEMRMQNQEGTLKSLENQVGQISQVLKSRSISGFPSDTEVAKGATHEQCKVISTRSDKFLEPPTKSKQGEVTIANSKKKRIGEFETVAATETCQAMMHNKVPTKKTNPGSFTIPCSIGHNYSTKALVILVQTYICCQNLSSRSLASGKPNQPQGYRFGRLERSFGSFGKVKTDFSVLLESVSIASLVEERRQEDQGINFCSSMIFFNLVPNSAWVQSNVHLTPD
ncbi:hypothetical protein GQ457_05G026930 [Hibiscus cannabinus]